MSSRIDARETVFQLAHRYYPKLLEAAPSEGTGALGINLKHGMQKAHNQNVKVLKTQIARIYSLSDMPAERRQWGIHNAQTASLLRPMGVVEGSKEWYVT
jgi:hypothetical protein